MDGVLVDSNSTGINNDTKKEYKDQIFADNTHLTDRGNKLLAEKIFELESFK